MTTPEDRELEALLREQSLLPVPLALIGRILDDVILDDVLPLERVRPWTLAARAAAAVLVFCASWLALSGDVPAFADVSPQTHVAAALPDALPAAPAASDVLAAGGTGAPQSTALWLGAGTLVFLGGLAAAWRLLAHAARDGVAAPGGGA